MTLLQILILVLLALGLGAIAGPAAIAKARAIPAALRLRWQRWRAGTDKHLE